MLRLLTSWDEIVEDGIVEVCVSWETKCVVAKLGSRDGRRKLEVGGVSGSRRNNAMCYGSSL